MIVEKAVNMARMMNIPVLGVVENMSWITCPDCDRKIYPFGESKTAKIALEHGIPLLAQLPVDPALARACDTGVIELFNEDWMDPVLAAVEACPSRPAEA
jgi:ATPases involved in chromosome partitioning